MGRAKGDAAVALRPEDIEHKEFPITFRGYHVDEVNAFLEQVAREMALLLEEQAKLRKRVAELEERLNHYGNLEETLTKTLVAAEKTAEQVKANAHKEAELILREAEKNADRIVEEALAKVRKINLEIDELKQRAIVYRNRFRTLLEAQLEMLQGHDWDGLTEETFGEGRGREELRTP